MDDREAVALAAELAGAYPGRGISGLTVSEWTRELVEEDRDDAVLAVGDLVKTFPDRAPSLGQLREALRIRRSQLELTAHEEIGYSRTTDAVVDHWRHGALHLAELLALPKDQRTDELRQKAYHPDTCPCTERPSPTAPADIVKHLAERYG